MSTYAGIGITPGLAGYHQLERALADSHSHAVVGSPVAVGICDTDKAMISGAWAGGPGADGKSIITGHETVLRLDEILGDSPLLQDLIPGNLYMVVVRQPLQWPEDGTYPPVHMMAIGDDWKEFGIHRLDGGLVQKTIVDARALVKVPEGISAKAAVFIETASCPYKGMEIAEKVHAVYAAPFQSDPSPKKVLVVGATGSCGRIACRMFQAEGYEVVGLSKTAEDSPRAQLLRDRGIPYIKWSDAQGFVQSVRATYGPFRYIFDAAGDADWINQLEKTLHYGGGVIEFSIPAHPQVLQYDLSEAGRFRTLNNNFRVGTVNADISHWHRASRLIAHLVQNDPTFFDTGIVEIDGLDVHALHDALLNKAAGKPMVFPNGL